MPVCHSVWSCRTFVRDRNESDKTAPTACYWCPGCLLLQQHEKKKIWIPHKIMVNRTTCRKLSPNIWKTLIIMIINGNKENTLSKVIYKLFQVFCYIFLKIIYSAFTNLYLLCVRNRTSGPLAWTVRTHTLWQELSPPPAMY